MSALPSPDSTHPAQLAAWRSADAAARGDKEAWVGNFADDGIVEDPVGKSMIDPSGQGFRGKEAIAGFFDENIGPNRPMFHLQHSICCGNECVNVGTLTIELAGGAITQLFGVFHYTVDEAGKVLALRTFWEADDMKVFPPMAKRAG